MSAHDRAGASVEAYLCRVIAALAKKNGGELRVRGADVDKITEPAVLIKDWDDETQEVVIRLGSAFNEVYRVNPSQPKVAQLWKQPEEQVATPTETAKQKKTSTLEDNEKLTELENNMIRHRIARRVKEEIAERAKQGNLQL